MNVNHPATRLLSVLELLQTHGRLGGEDLARRLHVDRRTIRRYVALLEEMGVPITTGRGRFGGYELVAGFKLPPMMFTDEEVLALSLGLAAVKGLDLIDSAPAAVSAQAKLERVVPAALKTRMRSVAEAVSFGGMQPSASRGSSALPVLSAAAHTRHGVRLGYRDSAGAATERDFDPYGLAFTAGRWYVAGYCHLRRGLRTFRLDRIEGVNPQTRPFSRPPRFDVVAHLALSIAALPRRFAIEVRLETDLDSARRELFPTIGILEPLNGAVLLRSQADDLDWFARELARLPWPFRILRPRRLIEALTRHA